MAKGIGKWDGAILGGVLGVLIAYPEWATKINGWVVGIIPADWVSYGVWVIPAIFIGVGALIGFMTEKSR